MLLADYKGYRRVAQLRYAPLAGGDVSVLRPYRMALAHLWAAGLPWDDDLPPLRACPDNERAVLSHQLQTGLGCVPTSSMGRLFDAVAALAGARQTVDYEAQAAIELEGISRDIDCGTRTYAFGITAGGPVLVEPAPVLAAVIDDLHTGVPLGVIGARFHRAVADLVVHLAELESKTTGSSVVALSGGVFQNALLLGLALSGLHAKGFEVITHHHVPPNDGGIALGQLLVGNSI
jgi:hydrogenase maturation protein HypF